LLVQFGLLAEVESLLKSAKARDKNINANWGGSDHLV
jgi:hypothetical protein